MSVDECLLNEDCSALNAACVQGVCEAGRCVAQPLAEGEPCDDGLFCTTGERCVAGLCAQGAPLDCSNMSEQCQVAHCDERADACLLTPRSNGLACDDGDDLTVGEVCREGLCEGGVMANCLTDDDCSALNLDCLQGVCDLTLNSCVLQPINDGQRCDDGLLCTTNDRCSMGVCAGEAVTCGGAGELCSPLQCDPSSGACVAQPARQGEPCDDSDVCTQGERCDVGRCVGGGAIDCSALAGPCVVGLCDPQAGGCSAVELPNGSACDDQDASTTRDTCRQGQCVGITPNCSTDVDCQDGNPCTSGQCVMGLCEYTPEPAGTPCDDGLFCTQGEACDGRASCVPAGPTDCTDPHACTLDRCNELSDQCEHQPVDTLCDNSLFCDGVERCDLALGCVSDAPPCAPEQMCDEPTLSCLGINPNAPDELAFQAALALYTSGDFINAISAFEQFAVDFPTSPRVDNVEYLLARSHFEIGDFALARQLFNSFISQHPTSSLLDDASYYVARCAQELLELQVAADAFSAFLLAFPQSPLYDNALYNRGRVYFDLALFDQALISFDELITLALSPQRDAALLWAGRCHYELGKLAGPGSAEFMLADQSFELLLLDYPGSVYEDNAHYYYGMSAYANTTYTLAITRFDALRTLYPMSVYLDNAHYFLARSYYQLNDDASAITELSSFVTSYPMSVYLDNARYFLGRAYYREALAGVNRTANLQSAAVSFRQVIDLHPTSAYFDNAYYNLVRTQARLNDCPAAQQTLTEFQAADPASPLITNATNDLAAQGC